MARGLTVRAIETAKIASARREVPDGLLTGLYLVVQPTGKRAWCVRYRHNGRSRKLTIGPWPAVDLSAARNLGAKALRAAAEGRDPATEKKQARAMRADGIEAVASRFIELHCRRANRPRTAEETARLLKLHVLPRWRGRLVGEITRRDVLEILDLVVEAGTPIAANRTLSAVRKMFNWCVARDIITVSPCAGVKPPTPERSRDRVLTDSELRLVWQAAGAIGYPFGSAVELLILTGQRRDEVAKMEWSEVDLNARLWILPRGRVKNNQQHEVPLSDAAVAVLGEFPRIGTRFAFTTTGECASNGYSKNKRRLDALLPPDMPPWRLHDLRRTVASGMARLGINLPVIEKVLNHSSGSFAGIVGVYQRHSFAEEKRVALNVWGRFVGGLVSEVPPTKVVALRG